MLMIVCRKIIHIIDVRKYEIIKKIDYIHYTANIRYNQTNFSKTKFSHYVRI